MTQIPVVRRLWIAGAALFLSAIIFHGNVALALVTRGDDYLTRGNLRAALSHYLLASRLDASLGPAVDRYVFFSAQERTPGALSEAVRVASAYLLNHPRDGTILADRALCYEMQKRYGAAAADFSEAARQTRSARYFTFAGWASWRSGNRRAAENYWRSALRVDTTYGPARAALRKAAQ